MDCSGCGKDHNTLGGFRLGRCCMCGETAILCAPCSDRYDKVEHYQTVMCSRHFPVAVPYEGGTTG